ncbi:PREDICTED: protein trichome birefringence-like 21 [Camelina sativa]|uniref:Protein trichome birefringence-like 21 n=1 Tax=Camelina sativa TaxID=90675 RepID=A0ABM0XXK5_CAMSA|nr:PREDICTED: protein trichome birefringence-like 21 [Camelina sativa]
MISSDTIVSKQTMELPLFAILQRTPRVAVTLAFALFLFTIVPALYSLLANPILPLSISSSETDRSHMHFSHLNISSTQIHSPVNGPIPAPHDHTPSRHRKSSFHQIPTPENGPIPSPTIHTPSRQRSPSSHQILSPKSSPITAPPHWMSSPAQSPSPVNAPIPAPLNQTSLRHRNSSSDDHSSPVNTSPSRMRNRDDEQRCDLFTGEWVPNEEAPYYTNTTCWAIHEHQNCMKYGRPDTGFLRWRWKPDGCDLPIIDPQEFLEMVRGKAMGFVGDSISRNQVQSLLCLLSRVEYPEDISPSPNTDFKVWNYTSYNFTLHAMWSPFLVKTTKPDPTDPKSKFFSLYLDEYDTAWTSQLDKLDYLVISSGHWFYRPVIFYENKKISGCQYCALPNTTELPLDYGYRKALRISLKAILENFNGLAFLRSFSPQHFEGGAWNEGGDCVRTRPYRRNETIPEGSDLQVHDIQLEEFRAAEEEGRKKKGLRLKLMDMTQAMLLRPDGHPGRYGHLQNAGVTLRNDCIHWCLPGPIDTWNDILLQMMKTEN